MTVAIVILILIGWASGFPRFRDAVTQTVRTTSIDIGVGARPAGLVHELIAVDGIWWIVVAGGAAVAGRPTPGRTDRRFTTQAGAR